MALSIKCENIGATCDYAIQGNSVDELVSDAADHAVAEHGLSKEVSKSDEWHEQMRAVIRNASRPAELRASSPPVPPAPYGS